MKKQYIIAVGVAMLLSACSGKQETVPAADSAQQQEAAKETATAPATPVAKGPAVGLPSNIQLPFAYSVVYEREVDVQKGKQKRVLVEFLDGDLAQIDTQLSEAMAQAGYRRAKPRDEDGGIRANYRNAEDKRVTTLIRTGNSVKLKNPQAKGNVYFAWSP